MPFGEARGTVPPAGAWPGTKGFVGGTQDPTGLTHLGAREYDPRTVRFLSADAVIDPTDPHQLNGYAYGHNNPLRRSDPTGDYDPDMMAWCQDNPGRCQGGRIIPSKPSKPQEEPQPRHGQEARPYAGRPERVPQGHHQGALHQAAGGGQGREGRRQDGHGADRGDERGQGLRRRRNEVAHREDGRQTRRTA
ncbi:RHS repeat-associated core domain-containing protein [Streptomyces sp. IBSBF 2807]|nr:RHS repeat-associated core domain-containing protein [Streptomyces hilarionis]